MPILRGEEINIGFGLEGEGAGRGIFVDAQDYISGTSPAGVAVEVKKVLLKETKASGISSQGSEVVQSQVGGSLEFNLRVRSIGYLLKSLLGKCTTSPISGAYSHKFEVLPCDPQFPTLSISLAKCGDFQNYGYTKCLAKALEIKMPVDNLASGSVEFIGSEEAEKADFDVVFNDNDYAFRPEDISIKVADTVALLSSATPLNLIDSSFKIDNAGKPRFNLGHVAPTDNVAGLIDLSGSIQVEYEDETMHDLYINGSYKAMQITLKRTDIEVGTGQHPQIVITLAKVSFEKLEQDRPMDDVVSDKVSFQAHYDVDESEAINIVVVNEVVDYEPEMIS